MAALLISSDFVLFCFLEFTGVNAQYGFLTVYPKFLRIYVSTTFISTNKEVENVCVSLAI